MCLISTFEPGALPGLATKHNMLPQTCAIKTRAVVMCDSHTGG